MGGGAGVEFKFWFDGVDLAWHPKSPKEAGVLVAKAPPKLLYFSARGHDDGMNDVRGDLWVVSDFNVVVPREARATLRENMARYPVQRPGDVLFYPLLQDGGEWIRDEPSYKEMIWRGWVRGRIEDVVFWPGGHVDIYTGDAPPITWGCKLSPTPDLFRWYRATFEAWRIKESEDWDSQDWECYFADIRDEFGYSEQ